MEKCYTHFCLFLKPLHCLERDNLSTGVALAEAENVPLSASPCCQAPSVWPMEASALRCLVAIFLYVGMSEAGRLTDTLIMTSQERHSI